MKKAISVDEPSPSQDSATKVPNKRLTCTSEAPQLGQPVTSIKSVSRVGNPLICRTVMTIHAINPSVAFFLGIVLVVLVEIPCKDLSVNPLKRA
jgi:hypothetical protein